jgi:hypothetical protein
LFQASISAANCRLSAFTDGMESPGLFSQEIRIAVRARHKKQLEKCFNIFKYTLNYFKA